MYDTVRQYSQVLSGAYDDWHPPVMARLWALLQPFGQGTAPMFALQLAAYWLGLGALAQGLGGRRAIAVLLIGASPLFLGWQAVVLKDGQLVGALACAVGLIAAFRLRDRPIPWPAGAGIALCLVYATLLRANAAFSTVPLIVLLFVPPRTGAGRRFVRPVLVRGGIVLAIVAAQFVNRHGLGGRDSGVSRIEAIYDLAGVAVRTGDVPGVDGPALVALHCVKPLFWDPMQSRADCQAALGPVHRLPAGQLYRMLARAALAHPVAYAEHRIAHLNATLRWLVPSHWPLAAPPAYNEPNVLGLESPPCCTLLRWQYAAADMIETPLGWPIFWIAAGLLGLALVHHGTPGPRRDLATALLVSALCQEVSFAVLSISSDLRYHLWAMLAVALAWVLVWGKWQWTRRTILGLAGIGLVLVTGLAARLTLPEGPVAYQDLLS
jgi:hypothetical protein